MESVTGEPVQPGGGSGCDVRCRRPTGTPPSLLHTPETSEASYGVGGRVPNVAAGGPSDTPPSRSPPEPDVREPPNIFRGEKRMRAGCRGWIGCVRGEPAPPSPGLPMNEQRPRVGNLGAWASDATDGECVFPPLKGGWEDNSTAPNDPLGRHREDQGRWEDNGLKASNLPGRSRRAGVARRRSARWRDGRPRGCGRSDGPWPR